MWCLEEKERDMKAVFIATTSKVVLAHAMRHIGVEVAVHSLTTEL
jgi:hypothetical protein